jgi:hypothetical protein
MMLHKLRRAMVNLERERLRGEVEVDESWVEGTRAGLRGSRQLEGREAALALAAVEKRGRAAGRVHQAVVADFKSTTQIAYLRRPERCARFKGMHRVSKASRGCHKPGSDMGS